MFLEYEYLWAMLVPVWIFLVIIIFLWKQFHCSSMPASNTFEGNLNLLIVSLFVIFYIYADTEKMQHIDKNIYIVIVSLVLFVILTIGSVFLIQKIPREDFNDKNEKLISDDVNTTHLYVRCYRKPLNIAWFFVYTCMSLTLILYVIYYDVYGLVTWLTLFIGYMLLVHGLCLFRRKSGDKKVLILSMFAMFLVIITVGVEFIFKDVCMKISPKRYIYPILAGILVVAIMISTHFKNNTREIPFST